MITKLGRTNKYSNVYLHLSPYAVYIPATICDLAVTEKAIGNTTLERQRLRITLGQLGRKFRFPRVGDGTVLYSRQPAFRGWFGWRWKDAANKVQLRIPVSEIELLEFLQEKKETILPKTPEWEEQLMRRENFRLFAEVIIMLNGDSKRFLRFEHDGTMIQPHEGEESAFCVSLGSCRNEKTRRRLLKQSQWT